MAFGAKGDGTTLETEAINRALEAAAAAGGGAVLFLAANYLSYSIHLRSNVPLYLGSGATIIAADSPATKSNQAYDPAEPNSWDKYQHFGHSHRRNSLIWGEGIQHVSIFGPGLIWGKGLSCGEGDTVLPDGMGNKSISLNVTLPRSFNSARRTFRYPGGGRRQSHD
jgi:polygalacturonase